MTQYLDLADYLLIAEAVLRVPAEEIAHWPGIGLADSALHAPEAVFGGVELYRTRSPTWAGSGASLQSFGLSCAFAPLNF